MAGIDEETRAEALKKMTELLRGGATMLADTCPLCGSPLFKLRSGEIVCPIHGRVLVAKTEEEVAEASVLGVLTELEKGIVKAIAKSLPDIGSIRRIDEGESLARALIYWLDALERIERIKSHLQARRSSGSG